jgi:MarR family transcriptional regulator, organic hydroperoxide resistance regulator
VAEPRNLVIEQAVTAYLAFWATLLQEADPFWFQVDLTIAQAKCLVLLEIRKEITIGGIADALNVARPSASILVEQLVQARFATRVEDPADRRRSLVRLTPDGRDLANRLLFDKEQLMARSFAALQPSELTALAVGFKALAAAMNGAVI